MTKHTYMCQEDRYDHVDNKWLPKKIKSPGIWNHIIFVAELENFTTCSWMFQHCRPFHNVTIISSISLISQKVSESFQLWRHGEDRSAQTRPTCRVVWFDSQSHSSGNVWLDWNVHEFFTRSSKFLLKWRSMYWF